MIEFLTANWLWIALGIAMVSMHRHGGCGGHAHGHGGSQERHNGLSDSSARPSDQPDETRRVP